MVRIAGICVTKTVTLQADVTGLPEAVSEDVNLDTQETRVIRVRNINILYKQTK